jgi:hypothetical protein
MRFGATVLVSSAVHIIVRAGRSRRIVYGCFVEHKPLALRIAFLEARVLYKTARAIGLPPQLNSGRH